MASKQEQINHLLANVAFRIRQSLDLESILTATVEEVREILQVDRAIVYRFNSDWSGIVTIESVSDRQWSILGRTIKDNCFEESWLQPYREGNVKAIEDVDRQELDSCHVELLKQYQVKANLVIPIVQFLNNSSIDGSKSHLWGLLIVHQCSSSRQWHPEEVELLKQLSTHVAIAIQQAELLAQTQTELQERKKAELSLQASEERFRRLTENAQDVIYHYCFTPNKEIEYINPAIVTVTGYSSAEFYADPELFEKIVHPDDLATFEQKFFQSQANTSLIVLRWLHKDGKTVWLEMRNTGIFDLDGQLIGQEGIARELTEPTSPSIDRQELMSRSIDRFYNRLKQQITTNLPFNSYVCPSIISLLTIAIEFMRHLGVFFPFPLLFVICPVLLSASFGGILAGIVSASIWIVYEIYLAIFISLDRTITEGLFFVCLEALVLFSLTILLGRQKQENDRLHQALQSANENLEKQVEERTKALYTNNQLLKKEIEERQNVQEIIYKTRNFLQTVIDRIPVGVFVKDGRPENFGVFRLWNKASEKIIGLTSDQVLDKKDSDFFPPEQAEWFLHIDRQVFEKGMAIDISEESLDSHGQGTRILHTIKVPLFDRNHQPEYLLGICEDITERKQAEQKLRASEAALRQSEQRLQLALEGSGDGLWDWNIATGEVYFSPRWLEILEYNLDELPGNITSWERLIHPEDKPMAIELLNAHLEDSSITYAFDYRVQTKSGEWKWISNYGKVVARDENNKPIRMAGTHRDITKRKQAEQELKESEARFRSMADSAPVLIWMADTDALCIFFNKTWFDFTGRSLEQEWGNGWTEGIHPEDFDRCLDIYLTAFKQRQGFSMEYRLRRADGAYRWILDTGIPRTTAEGNFVGYIGSCIDITDRKQAESALRQSEERWQLALKGANDGVWDWNVQTNEVFYSARWKEMLGFADWEIVNAIEEWEKRVHPEDLDLITQAIQDHFAKKTPFYITEHRVLCKDGSYKWILDRGQALWDKDGNVVRMVGSHTDISSRKQTEEQLRWKEALLRSMTAASPLAFYVVDNRNDHILYFNHRFCEIWNIEHLENQIEVGELKNKDLIADCLARIEDVEAFIASCQPLGSKDNRTIVEDEIAFLDGRVIRRFSSQIRDEEDRYFGRLYLFEDITIRKQAEQEILAKSKALTEFSYNLKHLHRLNTTDYNNFEQLFADYLTTGCEIFQCSSGVVGSVTDNVFTIDAVQSPIENLAPKLQFPVENTYCMAAIKSETTIAYENVAEMSGMQNHPLYQAFQIESYLGTPIFVQGKVYGTLSFFSSQVRNEPFSDREQEIIELMAQSIGKFIFTYQVETERQQAETALRQAKAQLEARVVERTAELSRINDRLETELEERKQAESALQESERRWRSLLENVRLVVVGLDRSGKIDYVNHYFLELTGYDQAEILGKNWFDYCFPQSQKNQGERVFLEILDGNSHSHYQNSILTKSKEERIISWNNTILHDLRGKAIGTMSIGEDVTERYAIERMKDEFISVVSHELRTPLTSIHGALNLLSNNLVIPNSERGERVIKIASESTERLVRLVNDILELERLQSGKIRLSKEKVNAADLMLRALEQLQIMANRAGIVLQLQEQEQEQELEFWADGDRLIQLLTNLLSNAIKFSDRGSQVWLSVEEIKPTSDRSSDSLADTTLILFSVRDRGRGIPTDKLESIFERFHQVDATDSRRKGGTGLGLAICRSIVEQHNGNIWVESTLGKGSIFYFTIPKIMPEND